MHIQRLVVTNFRGLEKITLEAGPGLNVIAGPNAVGKTTILEAIRLAKSLLAQRFDGEAGQVLASLGATQNGVVAVNAPFAMLAHDPAAPISIQMQIRLDQQEVAHLQASSEQLAVMALQTQLARSINDNAFDLAQYLSTVEGQGRLSEAREEMTKIVSRINHTVELNINATLDTNNGQVRGDDPNAQMFITYLERSLSPNQAHFNYFTADRSLPTGEVAIQLGAGDIQQQVLSYMAQPAIKWQRVKQLIIQTLLLDVNGRDKLTSEFNLIFDEMLPGKTLSGVFFSEHGNLRVLVEDKSSGKRFDIDSMSSGEKGLVLTFLTLRLSSKNNTIVMLDEPELHLNAAVCSRITKFMNKHCVLDKGLQLFVCSHSPEIVRDAFEDEKSKLFHLRSSKDLTPVYQQDSREVFEVLNRLGASTADVLFSRGYVFVEGEHDALIIQAGYGETLQGFKVQSLGGRTEVEKEIPKLQKQETGGHLDKRQLFIFDRDRSVSSLASTQLVRVYQLERYCIENYLLDETILFDTIVSSSSKAPESRGVFSLKLEELAIGQLNDFVIAHVYQNLEPENAGLRSKEVHGKDFDDAALILWSRIDKLSQQVKELKQADWITDFVSKCASKRAELEGTWKADWKKVASGKIIIDDLYSTYEINMRKPEFKKAIISQMAAKRTETWRVLNSVLDENLNKG